MSKKHFLQGVVCNFALLALLINFSDSSTPIQGSNTQQSLQISNKKQQFQLPEGFVYVDDVDPTIISNLRYLTTQNFVGEILIGYYVNRAILTKAAALALKNVNADLAKDGYQIVIYDGYRPQKTVNRFIQWSFDDSLVSEKQKYYPYIEKSRVFQLGYVAKKSGHTRGSTVDLSIIKIGTPLKPIQYILRELQNGKLIYLLDDNTEDFGSSFDLMDQASHPVNNSLIAKEYMNRRSYLTHLMNKHGFKGLSTEWWHFTLINEPFPQTYFDFDIKSQSFRNNFLDN